MTGRKTMRGWAALCAGSLALLLSSGRAFGETPAAGGGSKPAIADDARRQRLDQWLKLQAAGDCVPKDELAGVVRSPTPAVPAAPAPDADYTRMKQDELLRRAEAGEPGAQVQLGVCF